MIRFLLSVELIPSVPKNVQVKAYTDNVLRVKWEVPDQNGESIQLYVVYYKSPADTNYKQVGTLMWRA